MKLKIKRLKNEKGEYPKMPQYQTKGSAGMDLCAFCDDFTIKPNELKLVPTGIAVEIEQGYVGLIYARSGLATKHGVTLSNCVGVIDSDYRGELKIGLCNVSDKEYTIKSGERICQLVIMPVCVCDVEEVDELSDTERGSGGFGSTGK